MNTHRRWMMITQEPYTETARWRHRTRSFKATQAFEHFEYAEEPQGYLVPPTDPHIVMGVQLPEQILSSR